MSTTETVLSPKDISIRAAPAPIRRFSKKALVALTGTGALLVIGSLAIAMSAPDRESKRQGGELYSTRNQMQADGLSALPISYSEVKRDVPKLGPTLPGDLGAPILQAQREGRYTIPDPMAVASEFERGEAVEADIRRAEQINAVRQSGLFFSNSSRDLKISNVAEALPPSDPFEALKQLEFSGVPSALEQDPNHQSRKEAFISDPSDIGIYNPHRIEFPKSPWQLMAGAVIPATLLTGINSDLPGQVIGQVTEPVYDTVTGDTVLIPQGSRIIGRYDSVVAFGQSRALIVWNRIILPNGTSIQINSLPGVDARGHAGLSDTVDHHTLRVFSAATLSSLISIGAELANDEEEEIARALRNATQDGAAQVGKDIVRQQLAVQPTIKIRPGWRLRIIVHQDIVLQPYKGNSQ